MTDRLTAIREAVAKDGMNIEDAYADRTWLLSEYDLLTAEVARITADIASHERFGKEFMAENRRLCTVLRDIKNLSPQATDHFDPFQTAKQMAAMALDTDLGNPTPLEALHASAPGGCKCADCEIDQEPCPACYARWWQHRHQNTTLIDSADSRQDDDAAVQRAMTRFRAALKIRNLEEQVAHLEYENGRLERRAKKYAKQLDIAKRTHQT